MLSLPKGDFVPANEETPTAKTKLRGCRASCTLVQGREQLSISVEKR